MREPRDVIGEQLEKHDNAWGWRIDVADAILAALDEAGYEVGKKSTVRHEVFPFTDADVLPPDETP